MSEKPITVQCKCGWVGEQSFLKYKAESDDLVCPDCSAVFSTWPLARRDNVKYSNFHFDASHNEASDKSIA
jgi:hypothetical protein